MPAGWRAHPTQSPAMSRSACIVLALAALSHAAPSGQPGAASLKIIGGKDIDIQRVPYMASIETITDSKWSHRCGGVIVGDRWVLTTAQCVGSRAASEVRVHVGTAVRGSGGQALLAEAVTSHTKYDAATLAYNVAVIKTKGRIPTSPSVSKVSVIERSERTPSPGDRGIVSGWGKVQAGAPYISGVLKDMIVTLVPRATCNAAYVAKGDLAVEETSLCAAGVVAWSGLCDDDFGGPLVNDLRQLIGIASRDNYCGFPGYPGVYTDLSNKEVNDFISSTIGGN